MPANARTLQLRPAVRRTARRERIAIASTVLVASAIGGVVVALLKAPPPPARVVTPVVMSVPPPATSVVAETENQPEAEPTALFDLAPVIHEGGLRVVVQTNVEPQWVGEDIRVSDHDGVRVVVRPASESARARFGQLAGSRLRLHGPKGSTCLAEVTGLVAVGRFAPDEFGEQERKADPAAAWTTAQDSHLIAGDLSPIEGDCAGAVWAQPESMTPPVTARIAEASADQTVRAVAELKRTARFTDAAAGGSEMTFEVKSIASEEQTLLAATALAEGCVDEEPVTTALYAVQPDGSLHEVGAGLDVADLVAAADFDSDGQVEILVREDALDSVVLRRRSEGYQVEARAEVPIYGCRC